MQMLVGALGLMKYFQAGVFVCTGSAELHLRSAGKRGLRGHNEAAHTSSNV